MQDQPRGPGFGYKTTAVLALLVLACACVPRGAASYRVAPAASVEAGSAAHEPAPDAGEPRPAPPVPGEFVGLAPEAEDLAAAELPASDESLPAELLPVGVIADELHPDEETTESPLDELAELAPDPESARLERERERVEDEPPPFDIPMVVNDQVLTWVNYYSERQRESFRAALARSGRYLPMFREIYAEAGLPLDLIYMAHVESGYKTSAYSRARARGIFQFMYPTARHYGLTINYWVDERVDPEKSARASARYLQKLYKDFGDWHLVLAAYNAGEGKIRRAMARTGRTDFWGLAETRHIRRETKNHVPAILAAILISKDPEKYGLEAAFEPPVEYETIQVGGAADLRVLARCAGSDVETLRQLNPALRRSQTPPEALTDVRVPPGTGAATLAALELVPRSERVLYARHRVRRGDTLSRIARAYGVSVSSIQQANRMGRSTLIREGRTLTIPTAAAGDFAAGTQVAVAAEAEGTVLTYRVRRGDTLYGIARRYETTPNSLAAVNSMSVDEVLRIGQRLRVVAGVRSPTEARRIVAGDAQTSGVQVASAAQPATGAVVHTVRRGDSLWRIARLYDTTIDTLCAANRISRNATLRPGTRLTVRME